MKFKNHQSQTISGKIDFLSGSDLEGDFYTFECVQGVCFFAISNTEIEFTTITADTSPFLSTLIADGVRILELNSDLEHENAHTFYITICSRALSLHI